MIGIIDYGVGNLGSVQNALNALGVRSFVSGSIQDLKKSKGLILPGDGAAGEGMRNLKQLGLDVFIKKEIEAQKPFLGICLGMQLLLETSEEGSVSCLGLLKGKVKKIRTKQKLPQIGWNTVLTKKNSIVLAETKSENYAYFIHSFACDVSERDIIVGQTVYGEKFCSVFEKGNILGTQFHPEKSGEFGRQILKNFKNLC